MDRPAALRSPPPSAVLACLVAVAAAAWLRLGPVDDAGPFPYLLPLLVALWTRDVRLLWITALALVGVTAVGVRVGRVGTEGAWALLPLLEVPIAAAVLHQVITGRRRDRFRAEHDVRQRAGQVLHDEFQQLLVGARLQLGRVPRAGVADGVREAVDRADDLVRRALETSDSLTVNPDPLVLRDRGLGPAVRWLAERMGEQHGLTVDAAGDLGLRLPDPAAESLVFDAVREALFNTLRHSGVRRATVDLGSLGGEARITVADAGLGMEPASSDPGGGGLRRMGERLADIGGALLVEAAPGQGTRVTIRAPLGASAASAQAHRPRIRVLLADDHGVVREGLANLLRLEPDMEVVGQAADGESAVRLASRLRPDVVVMDVTMPGLNGIDATRRIALLAPTTRVVGLSLHEKGEMASAMRDAGAVAYVTKGGASEALVTTIRSAAGRGAA